MTRTGALLGTPEYIAPEQARNAKVVDIRADIYSLGCSLYFLLTGGPPFASESLTELLLKHQMDEPVLVETLRPELPTSLAALVSKMMAKKPKERFQTPGEVVEALRLFARGGVPTSEVARALREQMSATQGMAVPLVGQANRLPHQGGWSAWGRWAIAVFLLLLVFLAGFFAAPAHGDQGSGVAVAVADGRAT